MNISQVSSDLKRAAFYGAMAMDIVLSVGAVALAGYFLDSYFQTAPVLTLVMFFVGCVAGVVSFFKLFNRFKQKINLNDEKKSG